MSEVTQYRDKGAFHFCLVTADRTYTLLAQDEDEGKQWVGILRAVSESVGAVAAPPPRKFNSSRLQVPEMVAGVNLVLGDSWLTIHRRRKRTTWCPQVSAAAQAR